MDDKQKLMEANAQGVWSAAESRKLREVVARDIMPAKPWSQSRTIAGAVTAVGIIVVHLLLNRLNVELETSTLDEIAAAIGLLATQGLVIYGRVKAATRIGKD